MATKRLADDNYILPRNAKASRRLTAQHFAFITRNGWLLHPTVAASLNGKNEVEILDVATGNGIFALQLAEERPDAKITGLDISSEQYPPAWTVPANVSLDVWNFFDPVPDKYVGRFDVVHVRLIVGAVIKKDKDPVVKNLVKLLKPGGYLQWQEAVTHIFHRVSSHDTATNSSLTVTHGMSRLQTFLDTQTGIFSEGTWFSDNMTETLERTGGLLDVTRFDPPILRSTLALETDLVAWSQLEPVELLRERLAGAPSGMEGEGEEGGGSGRDHGGGGRADGVHEKETALQSFDKEFDQAWTQHVSAVEAGEAWSYTVPVFIGKKPTSPS